MASSISELRTYSDCVAIERNCTGAHKAHKVLDSLQVGLPNGSSLECLRGRWLYVIPDV